MRHKQIPYVLTIAISIFIMQCTQDKIKNTIATRILNNQDILMTQLKEGKKKISPFAKSFELAIDNAYKGITNDLLFATQGKYFVLHEPKLIYTKDTLYPMYHLYPMQIESQDARSHIAQQFSANIKHDMKEIASHGLFNIYAKKTKIKSRQELANLMHFIGDKDQLRNLLMPIVSNVSTHATQTPSNSNASDHLSNLNSDQVPNDENENLEKQIETLIEHMDTNTPIHPNRISTTLINQIAKLTFYTHIVAIEDNLVYLYKTPIILADDAKTFSTSNLIELTPQNLVQVHSIEDIIKTTTWNKQTIINHQFKHMKAQLTKIEADSYLFSNAYRHMTNANRYPDNKEVQKTLLPEEIKIIGKTRKQVKQDIIQLIKQIEAFKQTYKSWFEKELTANGTPFKYPKELLELSLKFVLAIRDNDLKHTREGVYPYLKEWVDGLESLAEKFVNSVDDIFSHKDVLDISDDITPDDFDRFAHNYIEKEFAIAQFHLGFVKKISRELLRIRTYMRRDKDANINMMYKIQNILDKITQAQVRLNQAKKNRVSFNKEAAEQIASLLKIKETAKSIKDSMKKMRDILSEVEGYYNNIIALSKAEGYYDKKTQNKVYSLKKSYIGYTHQAGKTNSLFKAIFAKSEDTNPIALQTIGELQTQLNTIIKKAERLQRDSNKLDKLQENINKAKNMFEKLKQAFDDMKTKESSQDLTPTLTWYIELKYELVNLLNEISIPNNTKEEYKKFINQNAELENRKIHQFPISSALMKKYEKSILK